jgi:AraC-like DNA-binding protein
LATRRTIKNEAALTEPSTIRAFFLAPLVRELGTHGVPIDTFLRRYGLSAAQLTSLYDRVPLRSFVSVAEDAAVRLGRPFLGLELGSSFTLADLGPAYAMFILAKDVGAALSSLGRFQSAWQTQTLMELQRGPETSSLCYLIQDPSIWPRRQDAEFALASFTSFIRQLTTSRWRPVAVEFEHEISDRSGALTEFFNAPVRGNCDSNRLLMANTSVDQPLRWRSDSNEHDVLPILEKHLLSLMGSPMAAPRSVASQASVLVARRLGRTEVTTEAIAAELNMSVRSLRRHLSEEGTSFRQILQEHRSTLVEGVLRSSGERLSKMASRLGYSDGAVLSRAFKTWTGLSPRAYTSACRKR